MKPRPPKMIDVDYNTFHFQFILLNLANFMLMLATIIIILIPIFYINLNAKYPNILLTPATTTTS